MQTEADSTRLGGAGRSFEGGVFHGSLEGGRSGATLTLTGSAVLATTPEGERFALPYSELELSLGGASGKMWFCRSPDRETTLFCEDRGFAQALREAGQRDLVERLEALEHERSHALRRYTLTLLVGVLALAALVAGGIFSARHATGFALRALPISADKKIGKLAVDNMDLGGATTHDKVLNDAVKTVLKRLSQAQPSKFRFEPRVVDSSTVNAFALPGGPIVIYTGLLRDARSADEFAGVLAHEMAHVNRRHGMQRIGQSLGVVALIQLMFGDVSGVMAVAVELMRAGTINSYGRDDEREADRDAIERMRAAQLRPVALADFFERLRKESEDAIQLPAWLGTHPDLAERVRAVRAWSESHGESEPKPLDLDWEEVRRHAGAADDDDEKDDEPKPR
jgi:Zn-dependent protease with chaperone function